MYRIEAKIEGVVPVMFDRFINPEELDSGQKRKAKDSWKEELPLKSYVDKKGVYAPVDNIRMMLIGNKFRTGSALILGSQIERNKGKAYLNFCKACVWVVGPKDPMKVYFSPHRKSHDDYDERTFINNGKPPSRSLTRRPILTCPWSLEFFIDVVDDQFHETKIRQLFDVAGMRCGLGAYGPTFGRFLVTEWKTK